MVFANCNGYDIISSLVEEEMEKLRTETSGQQAHPRG